MPLDGSLHVQKPMSETRPKYGYVKHPRYGWTPEKEAELIARAELGQSNSFIAREFNMTRDAVCNKRAKMAKQGLINHIQAARWTAKEEAKLIELKVDGYCSREIANIMGRTIDAVRSKAEMVCHVGPIDLSESDRFAENAKEATAKLVALLCEHHPEHETRL